MNKRVLTLNGNNKTENKTPISSALIRFLITVMVNFEALR